MSIQKYRLRIKLSYGYILRQVCDVYLRRNRLLHIDKRVTTKDTKTDTITPKLVLT